MNSAQFSYLQEDYGRKKQDSVPAWKTVFWYTRNLLHDSVVCICVGGRDRENVCKKQEKVV